MRKSRRRAFRYGSLSLLECLLAVAVPEIASGQVSTCSLTANPSGPVAVGQTALFTASCPGGGVSSYSWSVNPVSGANCAAQFSGCFSSDYSCTFSAPSTTGCFVVSVTPVFGSFGGGTTYALAYFVNPAAPSGCTLQAPLTATTGTPVPLQVVCASGGVPTQFAWQIVSQPAGSAVVLPTPTSTPSNSFTPTVPGTYVVSATATSAGGASTPVQQTIVVTSPVVAPGSCSVSWQTTSPPVAQPAFFQVSCATGSAPAGYNFRVVSSPPGATVTFGQAPSPWTASATFSLPGTYVLGITATNSAGGASEVLTTVTVPSLPPVAPSGCTLQPATGVPGQPVALQASCAGGGSATLYTWRVVSQPNGWNATITPTTATGSNSFTPPVVGSYVIGVTASNAGGNAPEALQTITVSPNLTAPGNCSLAPTSGMVGQPVTLQATCGAGSAPTQYAWQLDVQPAGSSLRLPSPTTAATNTFTPTVAGTYVVSMLASNAVGQAPVAQQTITVGQGITAPGNCAIAPVAGVTGQPVALQATCATGNAATQYAWQIESQPAGSSASLPSPTTVGSNAFTPGVPGNYVVSVIASNPGGQAPVARQTVSVASPPQGATVTQAGGNGQVGEPGKPLGQPMEVLVTTASGQPVAGVRVDWTVTPAGTASVSSPTTFTDSRGRASVSVSLGSQDVDRIVRATASGAGSVDFQVRSVQSGVTQPAEQLTQAAASAALIAPTTQLQNVQTRLTQLRTLRDPRVLQMQNLRVTVNGRALPGSLDALFGAAGPAGQSAAPKAAVAPAAVDAVAGGTPVAFAGSPTQPVDALGGGARAASTPAALALGASERADRGGGASADNVGGGLLDDVWGVYVIGNVEVGTGSPTSGGDFDVRSKGVTIGGDFRMQAGHVLGASLGLMRTDTDLPNDTGTQEVKGYSLTLYGEFVPAQNAYVNAALIGGQTDYDNTRRNVSGGPEATSSPGGKYFGASLSAGYNWYAESFRFAPYGRIEYIDARVDGYQESGPAGVALAVSELRVKQTSGILGADVNYALSTPWGVLLPYARLEWQYLFNTTANQPTAYLLSSSNVTVPIAIGDEDRNFGRVGLGVQSVFARGVSAFLEYERLFGNDRYESDRFQLGIRVPF